MHRPPSTPPARKRRGSEGGCGRSEAAIKTRLRAFPRSRRRGRACIIIIIIAISGNAIIMITTTTTTTTTTTITIIIIIIISFLMNRTRVASDDLVPNQNLENHALGGDKSLKLLWSAGLHRESISATPLYIYIYNIYA